MEVLLWRWQYILISESLSSSGNIHRNSNIAKEEITCLTLLPKTLLHRYQYLLQTGRGIQDTLLSRLDYILPAQWATMLSYSHGDRNVSNEMTKVTCHLIVLKHYYNTLASPCYQLVYLSCRPIFILVIDENGKNITHCNYYIYHKSQYIIGDVGLCLSW